MELDKLLNDLPSELEELLQRILERLNKRDRTKAYQTISLVQTTRHYHMRFSLLRLGKQTDSDKTALGHDIRSNFKGFVEAFLK